MRITSVEKQNEGSFDEKYAIFLDGEYAFTVDAQDYFRLHLYERDELTGEEAAELGLRSQVVQAKKDALRFIGLSVRCTGEVRNRLFKKGYPQEVIDRTIRELEQKGYLNDRVYIEKYLSDRSKLKPQSRLFLKYQLLQKGLDEDLIDEVMGEREWNEEETAANLVKKKFARYNLEDEEVRRKAAAFLRTRGFDGEIIRSVLERLTNNETE